MQQDDDLIITCLASGFAGLVGRMLCHPMDTIKAKLQSSDSPTNFLKIVSDTWKQEKFIGFYRGLGAVLVGGVPGVCVYLSSYEYCKQQLQSTSLGQQYPFYKYMISGITAEAICCLLFIPVDVVKERLQVQSTSSNGYQYRGSLDAITTILRQEGHRGLYKGYWATLFSYGPFSSIYFWIFEEMKAFFRRSNKLVNESADIPFRDTLISSAAAGSAASFLTTPLDIAKLRFQTQLSHLHAANDVHYRGLFHALYVLYGRHGVTGLFRGATARVLFHTPSTAITMACYEEIKSWWRATAR